MFIILQYKFFVDGEWRYDEHQPYANGEYGLVNTMVLAADPNFFHPNVTPEITSGSNMEEDTEAFQRLVRLAHSLLFEIMVSRKTWCSFCYPVFPFNFTVHRGCYSIVPSICGFDLKN